MADLIVFGSARMDAFLDIPDDKAATYCSLDDRKCVLELSYSAKIPLESVEFLPGGNGANLAVGTKRLGVESLLIAEIGEGIMAEATRRELEKEIDTKYVSQSPGVKQGFGAVVRYQGERTILSYYSPKQPDFPHDLPKAPWAYLTSTGENFENYYDQIYDWMNVVNPRLAFNPGGRQISKGIEWMSKYLQVTELLILNREEAEELVSMEKTHGEEKKLIDALRSQGPKKVIVTDGMNGTFAFDGERYVHAGVLPYEAIERTGAGDAFSTGSLSALIKGKSMSEALMWGTVNATSVVLNVGPQPGLLDKEGMIEWLDKAKEMKLELVEF